MRLNIPFFAISQTRSPLLNVRELQGPRHATIRDDDGADSGLEASFAIAILYFSVLVLRRLLAQGTWHFDITSPSNGLRWDY